MNRLLTIDEFIKRHDPCRDAVEWLRTQPTLEAAWGDCQRSDWLLWVARQVTYQDVTALRWIALETAESVRRLMQDERSANALEVIKRFLLGQATQEELETAAYAAAYAVADAARVADAAAYAVADVAADVAAYAAAYAVADAARVADAAAYAAAYAARVAYAAAYAAQSDIVRKHITWQQIESYLSINESEM